MALDSENFCVIPFFVACKIFPHLSLISYSCLSPKWKTVAFNSEMVASQYNFNIIRAVNRSMGNVMGGGTVKDYPIKEEIPLYVE